MPRTVAPYGTWPSPITVELLTERVVTLSQLGTVAGRLAWVEGRPSEGGRQVLVVEGDGAPTGPGRGAPVDLVPPGFSARTQVHEYGGRCWAALPGGAVVASNWEDQRLWRFAAGQEPVAVTAEPPGPRAVRYADPVVTPDGRWAICVRERHLPEGVDNDLVAVPVDRPGPPAVLASGHDFYSSPALSPGGRRLAWLSWDHPNMPWDDTECWVADLDPVTAEVAGARRVAGQPGESVQQPRWSPDGVLHWVSDRTGWWNLYRGDGEALCPMAAELGEPGWVFGISTYTFTADGRLVATWHGPGGSGIGVVEDGRARPWDLPWTGYDDLAADGDQVACVASSPSEAPAVVRIGPDGRSSVVRASRTVDLDPGFLSRPERLRFPTGDGQGLRDPAPDDGQGLRDPAPDDGQGLRGPAPDDGQGLRGPAPDDGQGLRGPAPADGVEHAWALVYPPASATHEAPAGERPPLVVMCHGGPTSAARSALNLAVQYWTSRGFAVADVDYRGSTGYGTAYRNRLRGSWGVCDVEDGAAVARWLASEGRVDPGRCVIRGGSAGGYTTLACLAFTDAFAAGASHYGVADLAALAADTHKFESRYLDRMIGPWPEAADTYRARSPIHHLDGFDRPLILFQGLEDRVVPPAQSEMIHEALRSKGIPVAYLAFEGEQHGFRRAETQRAVMAAELSFYGRVLGFRPDGAVEVPVDNEGALGHG